MLGHELDRLATIHGDRDDFDAWDVLEETGHAGADHRMVLGEDDADLGRHRP
jgi:hypothetical protein